MRLMRNTDKGAKPCGKYTVFDNRTGREVVDAGPFERNEFFVIMLKDRGAQAALLAYALSHEVLGDREYATDVEELAKRAGPASPYCKMPD